MLVRCRYSTTKSDVSSNEDKGGSSKEKNVPRSHTLNENLCRFLRERFHSLDQRPYLFNEKKKKKKEVFALQKSSTPTGLIGYTNMANFSLFRYNNMADMTSRQ